VSDLFYLSFVIVSNTMGMAYLEIMKTQCVHVVL